MPSGLSPQRLAVLGYVVSQGGRRLDQSVAAQALSIDRSRVSQQLRALERDDIVVKEKGRQANGGDAPNRYFAGPRLTPELAALLPLPPSRNAGLRGSGLWARLKNGLNSGWDRQ
jgi:hypothetical protein